MAERRVPSKTASLRYEQRYFRAGFRLIVGIDEAGRGSLAGPVAAAAVGLPLERADLAKSLRGLRDSKEMTAAQRIKLSPVIKKIASVWGIGSSSAAEIDRLGIVNATKAAMQRALDRALDNSETQPDCLFLDDMPWPERSDIAQLSIVKGDKLSLTIACASVLAKVWRDEHMQELEGKYGDYGFALHKGYGTPAHLSALRQFGPCAAHRRSFRPVAEIAEGEMR